MRMKLPIPLTFQQPLIILSLFIFVVFKWNLAFGGSLLEMESIPVLYIIIPSYLSQESMHIYHYPFIYIHIILKVGDWAFSLCSYISSYFPKLSRCGLSRSSLPCDNCFVLKATLLPSQLSHFNSNRYCYFFISYLMKTA